MMRWSVLLANAMIACAIFAADELPTADPEETLEIEPPLLIGNRAPDGSIVVAPQSADAAPAEVDLARLESDLARARKSAASGERLYKAGIIAKVEAEERVLKVIRLEANLADRATGGSEAPGRRSEALRGERASYRTGGSGRGARRGRTPSR